MRNVIYTKEEKKITILAFYVVPYIVVASKWEDGLFLFLLAKMRPIIGLIAFGKPRINRAKQSIGIRPGPRRERRRVENRWKVGRKGDRKKR